MDFCHWSHSVIAFFEMDTCSAALEFSQFSNKPVYVKVQNTANSAGECVFVCTEWVLCESGER